MVLTLALTFALWPAASSHAAPAPGAAPAAVR
jgi:hypothetical protein